MKSLGDTLEAIYRTFHHPRYISPDPLEVVLSQPPGLDREFRALVCASFALGRVHSILAACQNILDRIGSVSELVLLSDDEIHERCQGFVYRFFTTNEVVRFFCSVRDLYIQHGSIDNACRLGVDAVRGTDMPPAIGALRYLAGRLRNEPNSLQSIMIPNPDGSSALKRLHLFLRWMVRTDEIDPGGFTCLGPADLFVPVDVHMHRVAYSLSMTRRKSVDAETCRQITACLRRFCPEDPVRYDFSLTRIGIHPAGKAIMEREIMEI